jgi:hypothetical protein
MGSHGDNALVSHHFIKVAVAQPLSKGYGRENSIQELGNIQNGREIARFVYIFIFISSTM